MADLDEALFARPEVLDFSAGIERAPAENILHIEVVAIKNGENSDLSALQEMVEAIPVVQSAVRAGSLRVAVTIRKGGDSISATTMSKRLMTLS